ncbi:hypothetical protein OAN94_03645 [Verrucomicrobiales bacterium]|jgi:hypothetical protein|nr:hypothetical protein [Verrucomicrobiales bacterium]MDC0503348.1 hypothetical protein [Verrucomicrobiales bacterium]
MTKLNQGLSPHGSPPPDEVMLESDGFTYRHHLTFRNTSGKLISNFRFYHLLYSLQGNYSVYDSTDHGGAMAEYKHDFTQRGLSYSFHGSDGGLYAHTDYITAHSSVAPDAFSNGYYGIRGIDQHDIGKPSAGVHLDIETDTFTNVSEFEPKEGGWVAGATRHPLGDLGVDETKTFTLLFSLRTMSELMYKDPGIVLDTPKIQDDKLRLYINDPMDLFNKVGPGFSLESHTTMDESTEPWMPVFLPFMFNPAEPGRFSFEIPIDELERRKHFRVRSNLGF